MGTNELKHYLFEAFNLLQFPCEMVEDEIYEVQFPEKFKDLFNGDSMLFSFQKEHAVKANFITTESFLVKTVARLITQIKNPLMKGKIYFSLDEIKNAIPERFSSDNQFHYKNPIIKTSHYILFWVKFTLKGFKNEESIKIIRYDLEKKVFSLYNHDSNTLFALVEDENKTVKLDNLNMIHEMLMNFSKEEGFRFVTEKNKEASNLLEREIKRIHDYYDLLESEDAVAETSKTLETREERKNSLKAERLHLIEQQREKYSFAQGDLTILPIESLHLTETVECEEVEIRNSFAKKKFFLRADERFPFFCELTKSSHSPLTITSEGNVLSQEKVRVCSECFSTYEFTKIKFCAVCDKGICSNCSHRSHISHAVLCKDHMEECTSCKQSVSIHEIHECGSCKGKYCRWCLSGELCSLCDDLY